MVTAAALLVAATRRAPVRAATMAALAVCAVVITLSVLGHTGVTVVDRPVLEWVIAHRNGTLTEFALAFSDFGGTAAMAALAAVACAALAGQRRWRSMLAVVAASAGAAVVVTVIKQLVGRNRPPVADRLVTETNQAYPSGHSLGCLVVVGIVVVVAVHLRSPAARRTVYTIAAFFVAAVGVSRLYLGVHWPTDVLGGWSLGGLWLAICLARSPATPSRADRTR